MVWAVIDGSSPDGRQHQFLRNGKDPVLRIFPNLAPCMVPHTRGLGFILDRSCQAEDIQFSIACTDISSMMSTSPSYEEG